MSALSIILQCSSQSQLMCQIGICAGLQVLLGQLRYFPGLANTVPALHKLCLAAPKVLCAVHRAWDTAAMYAVPASGSNQVIAVCHHLELQCLQVLALF